MGFLTAALLALLALFTPAQPVAVTSGRADLTAQNVSITSEQAEPTLRNTYWPCERPMTIRPSSSDNGEAVRQLGYAIATLRALGYDVRLGAPVDYRRDMGTWLVPGEVVVTVAPDPAEQVELEGLAARALKNLNGPEVTSATIIVDNGTHNAALTGDILLHELGHVLGLDHHDGSVMAEGWDAPATFDAADVAAVSCR